MSACPKVRAMGKREKRQQCVSLKSKSSPSAHNKRFTTQLFTDLYPNIELSVARLELMLLLLCSFSFSRMVNIYRIILAPRLEIKIIGGCMLLVEIAVPSGLAASAVCFHPLSLLCFVHHRRSSATFHIPLLS
jgi:hypothetical protein